MTKRDRAGVAFARTYVTPAFCRQLAKYKGKENSMPNVNGLTYSRWLAAAGRKTGTKYTRRAWAQGEDPSEWRASSRALAKGAIDLEALGAGLKSAMRRAKRALSR